MLRTLALALLFANLLYWAYAQGHLAPLGLAPHDPREPQRLAQQVSPGALEVLNATPPQPVQPAQPPAPISPPLVAHQATPEPAPVQSPEPVMTILPPTCWQATAMPEAQALLVRAALDNMEGMSGLWALSETLLNARWIVYLGPFPSDAALQQRRAELRRANVDHRELPASSLFPGLALGTFSTEEAAQRALAAVTRQGVSAARVVQERPDTRLFTLRLEGVTEAQRRRIEATGILRDRPLQSCL